MRSTLSRRIPKLEKLEPRWVQASLPFGAVPNDTGEFMLGRVAVTPIFLESTGQFDASTENWNPGHVDQTRAKIDEAFSWWQDLLATQTSIHTLDFVIDPTFINTPSPTAYEPINRSSNDFGLWTQEFLMRNGYDEFSSLELNMRAFNDAQRQKLGTDWAFTMFVVNSQNDIEGTFASGTFSRAFAFAGGLFMIVPSTRPASTFAHETGHMFWARDEYVNSASFFARRGYYNTQNTNAIDGNPDPFFQQAPSIMSAGTSLANAYTQLVSPASTLAMLGWQDSDGDGIFDVLDVPLLLDGVGRVDVSTGSYRFTGSATVQTLPNINSSGLGNDITLNRISRIEAKIGTGQWKTVATPNVYEAALDVSVPLEGVQSGPIQIRAIDDATGITSNIFVGEIGAVPDATNKTGINGFVFNDANANGLFDALETGIGATTVRLINENGSPINLERLVEPDSQVPGALASGAFPNVSLLAVGSDTNGTVGAFDDGNATTGSRVFRPHSISLQGFSQTWNARRQLRVAFSSPTSIVSVDVIGAGAISYGRLEAYDSNGVLLARVTSDPMPSSESQTLTITRDLADIAYIHVYGHMETGVKIDNLRYGPKSTTQTDIHGRYSFTGLPAGVYNVQVVLTGVTSQVTTVAGRTQTVDLQSMERLAHINYGINFQTTAWHNANLPADVNADGTVSAIDVLLIINLLNQNVPSALIGGNISSPPYVDVSNDAFLTAIDALMVINAINSKGESEAGPAQMVAGSGASAEGEACAPFVAESVETSGALTSNWLAEGEFVGPALPSSVRQILPVETSRWAESETPQCNTGSCVVEQLASDRTSSAGSMGSPGAFSDRDVELIRRLQSNPWTLPQPCNCAECLSIELASTR